MIIKVYGASDDLVEVESDNDLIREEFNTIDPDKKGSYLEVTTVEGRYYIWPNYHGVWTFRIGAWGEDDSIEFPRAVVMRGPNVDEGEPSYTAVVEITTNEDYEPSLRWVEGE